MSDPQRERDRKKSMCTYIHTHNTREKRERDRERKIRIDITLYPSTIEALDQKTSNRSETIEQLILNYALELPKDQSRLNVFINKPQIVRVERIDKAVIVKAPPDYSKLSQGDLVNAYLKADSVQRQAILFELKQRGVNIRDFQRRNP